MCIFLNLKPAVMKAAGFLFYTLKFYVALSRFFVKAFIVLKTKFSKSHTTGTPTTLTGC